MSARHPHRFWILCVCALAGAACASEKDGSDSEGVATAGTGGATTAAPAAAGGSGGTPGTPTNRPTTGGSGGSAGTATTTRNAGTAAAGQSGQAGHTAAAVGGGSGGIGNAGAGGAQAGAGAAGSAGAAGGGAAGQGAAGQGAPSDLTCPRWPTSIGDEPVASSIRVGGNFDGKLKRYAGAGALGADSQEEGQDPLFLLADGATLENVILGAPGADGIHCEGSCTLRNVWWEDVGEDAATLKGSSERQVMSIQCGGARKASDKVFQHNGPGTMRIENFVVEDFGKLYRSCGNCETQHERHVEMKNIEATQGGVLAGINTNYGDTAKFESITLHDSEMKLHLCDRFTGNDQGDEPQKIGSGADGASCIYEESTITWAP